MMAKYICPSCGKSYNGKLCRNCLYENFTETASPEPHAREAEPPVVEVPARKPAAQKTPSGSGKNTRRSPVRLGVAVAVFLVLMLAAPFFSAVSYLAAEVGSVVSSVSREPEPEPTLPSDGTVLYDRDGMRIVADWQDGQEYTGDVRVVAQNDTGRDLTVSARTIVVNGYVLEDSLLYCQVKQGRTAESWFRLMQSDLENAGIETVQELFLGLAIYDSETYETLVETDLIPLHAAPGAEQPVDDSGIPLVEQDGIRVIYRGYVPSEYEPEEFSSGTLQFFLENDTDFYLDYYTREVHVNGERIWMSLWCALPPHTRAVCSMYLYALSSEEGGIERREDVQEMTMTLEVSGHEDDETFLVTDPLYIPLN